MRLSAFLLAMLLLCNAGDAFHRMYETVRSTNDTTDHAFHCLYNFYIHEFRFSMFKFTSTVVVQMFHFCRRTTATKSDDLSPFNTKVVNGKEFTFTSLREMGISAQQLFDWYAPMDIIEEYALEHNNGFFYNCTRRMGNYWFGPRCQYTFGYMEDDLFKIIRNQLNEKSINPDNILSFTNGSCYLMNNGECQSILCLDWREICDGKLSFN
jgi:hypothetical protein